MSKNKIGAIKMKKIGLSLLLSMSIFYACNQQVLPNNTNIVKKDQINTNNIKLAPNINKTEIHGVLAFPKTRKEKMEEFKVQRFNTKTFRTKAIKFNSKT